MLTKLEYDEAGILLDIGEFCVYLDLRPVKGETVLSVDIGVSGCLPATMSNLTSDGCIQFTVEAKEVT